MAIRKKKVAAEGEQLFDGAGNPVEAETEEPLDEDVVRALVELDSANEIRWQILRVSNPNAGFVEELSTAELSMDRIAKDAGPGKYKVRGIRQDGTYYKSATISIAVPIRPASAGVAPPARDDSGTMQMITLMMQSAQASAAEQTKILTALIARPGAQIPWAAMLPVLPMLLKELREMMHKPDKDDASMERVLKLVTIVEKLKGKEAGEQSTNWADVVREGLSQVSAVAAARFGAAPGNNAGADISARVVQRAPDVLSHTAHPDSAARGTMDEQTANTEAVEPTIQMLGEKWLRDQLDVLIIAAANGRNPELRGELFVDEKPKYIPDGVVIAMLSADDWFAQLIAFDARVANHPAWFDELRDVILETLQPKGDAADEPQTDE